MKSSKTASNSSAVRCLKIIIAQSGGQVAQRQLGSCREVGFELRKIFRGLDETEDAAATVVEHHHTETRVNTSAREGSHVVLRRHVAGDKDCHAGIYRGGADSRGCASVDSAYATVAVDAVDIAVIEELEIAHGGAVGKMHVDARIATVELIFHHCYCLEIGPGQCLCQLFGMLGAISRGFMPRKHIVGFGSRGAWLPPAREGPWPALSRCGV